MSETWLTREGAEPFKLPAAEDSRVVRGWVRLGWQITTPPAPPVKTAAKASPTVGPPTPEASAVPAAPPASTDPSEQENTSLDLTKEK